MGVCTSRPGDVGRPPTKEAEERYRPPAIDVDAAPEDDVDDVHCPDAVSSDGHITTENEFLTAVRITANNIQSRILHGITSDANQFTEEYQPLESLLSLPQRKFMATWMDDHLQAAMREHLVTRLPKQLSSALMKPTVSLPAFGGDSSITSPPPTAAVAAFLDGDEGTMVTSLVHDHVQPPLPPPQAPANNEATNVEDLSRLLTPPQVMVGSEDAPSLSNHNSASVESSNGSGVMQRNPSARGGNASAEAAAVFPAMSLSNVVDLDLLVRLINAYCNKSRMPPTAADDAPTMPLTPPGGGASLLCNKRGKPVSLGDPLSALATTKAGEIDTSLELCGEYVDLSHHLRSIDRRSNNASSGRMRTGNGNGSSGGSNAGSPMLSVNASFQGGNLSFRSQSDACDADVSDFGGSLRSPLSPLSGGGSSATADMSQSPYAAHGSPWKERALNTETMKVHNKLMAMQEKQTQKEQSGSTAAAAAAVDRRPKVLMQLLFGPLILQTFWNASMVKAGSSSHLLGGSDIPGAGTSTTTQ